MLVVSFVLLFGLATSIYVSHLFWAYRNSSTNRLLGIPAISNPKHPFNSPSPSELNSTTKAVDFSITSNFSDSLDFRANASIEGKVSLIKPFGTFDNGPVSSAFLATTIPPASSQPTSLIPSGVTLVFSVSGGLVNQRICFAHGILFALRTNLSVVLPTLNSRRSWSSRDHSMWGGIDLPFIDFYDVKAFRKQFSGLVSFQDDPPAFNKEQCCLPSMSLQNKNLNRTASVSFLRQNADFVISQCNRVLCMPSIEQGQLPETDFEISFVQNVVSALKPNARLETMISDAVRTFHQRCDAATRPILAVHLRIEADMKRWACIWRDGRIENMNDVFGVQNGCLYVASGESSGVAFRIPELAAFEPKLSVTSLVPNQHELHIEQRALVDFEILRRVNFTAFVGCFDSCFSTGVAADRVRRGLIENRLYDSVCKYSDLRLWNRYHVWPRNPWRAPMRGEWPPLVKHCNLTRLGDGRFA